MKEEFDSTEVDPEEFDTNVKHEHDQSDVYYLVKVYQTNESLLCVPGDQELTYQDAVLVQTKNGLDLGLVLGRIKSENSYKWEEVHHIVRKANEQDLNNHQLNLDKAAHAFDVCRKKIEEHHLDMKLVTVHVMLEEPKIVFFFTSENRVDFRELVKDLVAVFHMRIELRQIGVRDESRIVGGKAVCGRVLCCSGVSDKLQPVSIKMAKTQNLSLNSIKISGPCGRLLCCLAYEYEAYRNERRSLPSEGCNFDIESIKFRVREVNILNHLVYLHGEDGRDLAIPGQFFKQEGNFWRFIGQNLAACEKIPSATRTQTNLL